MYRDLLKNFLYNGLPFAVLFGMMLVFHRFITLDLNTDDLYFSTIQDRFTLFDFLHHRYQVWSGRLTGEALIFTFLKYDLGWWKLTNSLLIVILCYGLSALLLGERFWLKDYRRNYKAVWFICIGLGWINMNILGSSMFWVTGSFAYLWMVAPASMALIPAREKIFGEPVGGITGFILKMVYLACAAIASLGNEQVSLVLIGFIALANIEVYRSYKKVDRYLLLLLVVVMLCSVVLFAAPGNHLRIEQEISINFPEFRELTWLDKVMSGVQWLMHKTYNMNRLLIMLLLTLLSLTFLLRSETQVQKRMGSVSAVFALLLIITTFNLDFLNSNSQEQWFNLLYNFRSFEKILTGISKSHQGNYSFLLYLLPYIVWGFALIWISICLYHLPVGVPMNGRMLALVYIAALATLVILFFTPAMTLSANRILFVTSIMFLWIAAALLHSIEEKIPTVWLVLILLVPVMNIIFQALEWAHGYSVLW